MAHKNKEIPKKYFTYPKKVPELPYFIKNIILLTGLILFPIYWLLASFSGCPGMNIRARCFWMGMKVLFHKFDAANAYRLVVSPMDSFRYFEFGFCWDSIIGMNINTYLDVSSPRIFPMLVTGKMEGLSSYLLNPDQSDLPMTIKLADSLGLGNKCRFSSDLIEEANLPLASFDLITSISVIEHIPDDYGAIEKIWSLLKPGGKLLITIPCSWQASEEYMNINEYGLLEDDKNGYVYWQRYYDEDLLRSNIYSITGEPVRLEIYGESTKGEYDKNVAQKRSNRFYPFWREPYMMCKKYSKINTFADMPGMGVVAMEFVKKKQY